MKIKVGEYVKTKTGKITRLIKIDKNYVVVGHGMQELQVYSKFKNSHYIYANNYEELYEKINKYITKHSFDIKKLIQEGDVVNGNFIVYRGKVASGKEKLLIGNGIIRGMSLEVVNIKTILTKEQYERECYRLEDN